MPAEFTIGVEEEYHLVEPGTGELRAGGAAVRAGDRSGEIIGEVHEDQIEIGTPICETAAEAAESLRELRFQASSAASAQGLEILAAGIHPFSSWEDQRMSQEDRPKLIASLFGQLIRQQHTCGLHIHVAIPPRHDRVRLMNIVREFIPHFLALGCSSPLYFGKDTGFASFRATAWRAYPFAGAPPYFESADEYDRFIEMLIRNHAIPDAKTVYWSIRPSSRFPTLEFRMCDSSPRLDEAVAIAALARAVVVAAAEGVLEESSSPLSAGLRQSLIYENEWFAARDGLDATLIDPAGSGEGTPLRPLIGGLLETVRPIADRFGDAAALDPIGEILAHGNAADRIRARGGDGMELEGIVDWLVQETRVGTGIDRRDHLREPALSAAEELGMKPLVALTTSVQPSNEDGKPKAVIFASYITVLQRVGLTPVLITPAHTPEAISDLIAACTGLVLSGGADIDPARYGQDPIPELGEVNRARDAAEFCALEVALERGIPVLGICRGHQLLNVFLGGTLCQDIEAAAAGNGHVQTTPWGSHHHGVTVVADSIVGRAIGAERIEINSYHHQALDEVAPALQVTARADDGMIEAVESREHSWVVGVQWHPERHEADAPETDPNIRVLAAFARAVRER